MGMEKFVKFCRAQIYFVFSINKSWLFRFYKRKWKWNWKRGKWVSEWMSKHVGGWRWKDCLKFVCRFTQQMEIVEINKHKSNYIELDLYVSCIYVWMRFLEIRLTINELGIKHILWYAQCTLSVFIDDGHKNWKQNVNWIISK